MQEEPAPPRGAALAASTLAALVVLSPWPFGSVLPAAVRTIILAAGFAALAGLATRRSSSMQSASGPALALLAVWTLGWLQLVPVPSWLHRTLAPGSAAIWLPSEPPAAAVLGATAHPISLSPAGTLRWLAFSAAVGGLALVGASGLGSRRALRRAAVAVVAGACAVAIYGLVARAVFGSRLFGTLAVPTVAPFGPFVSKNHFAGYVAMAACLALGLATGLADEARRGPGWLSWIDSRRAWAVVAAGGATLVLALAVPASLSRGGVIALAAGLTCFLVIRIATRRAANGSVVRQAHDRAHALVLAIGLLLAAAVLLAVLPDEARARVATIGGGDRASSYRLAVWRDALRVVAASPLVGNGFGSFADALPRFKTATGELRVEHAENDYLELVAEGGLVGALLALLGVGALLRCARRRLRTEPHRLSRALRAGALAGLAALLVHSAFDFNLHLPSNALLAALLAACALAPVAEDSDAERAAPGPSSPWAGVAAPGVAVASALALALAIAGRWTEPQVDAALLQRAAQGAALRRALAESELVSQLRRRPADAAAWVALGWLRLSARPAEAAALARWGMQLDPQHAAIRSAGARIVEAADPSRR